MFSILSNEFLRKFILNNDLIEVKFLIFEESAQVQIQNETIDLFVINVGLLNIFGLEFQNFQNIQIK